MGMVMNITNVVQGTSEWFAARCGRVTASRIKDVLAKIKSGEAAVRKNYKAQIVVERLTGIAQETYTNAAMLYGTESEPQARAAYTFRTDNEVTEVGFIAHPTLLAGCSPDGLIGEDGGLEIKCPFQSAVHIETLLNGIPPEHIAQIQGSLWITGRQWWDFVSFDGRMPAHLQLYVKRVERDDKYIAMLETEVLTFLDEVSEVVEKLSSL